MLGNTKVFDFLLVDVDRCCTINWNLNVAKGKNLASYLTNENE